MSEFIRKITGISGSTNVNYIPVVYYCHCSTAATTRDKVIEWYADSSATDSSQCIESSTIPVYRGLTLAVYFKNGIDKKDDVTSSNCYRIKIGDTAYPIKMNDDAEEAYYKGGDKKATVLLFEFSGSYFRLVNGVSRYMIDELSDKLEDIRVHNGAYVQLRQIVFPNEGEEVSNGGSIDIYEHDTGSANQFVYVKDNEVKPTTKSEGSDIRPLKMVSGKLQSVSYDLAKKSELSELEQDISDAAYGIKLTGSAPTTGQYKIVASLHDKGGLPIDSATVTFNVGGDSTDEKVKQVLASSDSTLYPVLTSDRSFSPGGAIPNTNTFITGAKLGYNVRLQPTKGVFEVNGTAGVRAGVSSSGYKVYDTGGTNQVAAMWHAVQGSSSTVGYGSMAVGNDIGSGTTGNAAGRIYVYGTSTGRNMIISNISDSSSRTNYLPNATGYLAVGSSSGVGSVSTPVYMKSNGELAVCTSIPSGGSTVNYYHKAGTYSITPTSATSGFKASLTGQGGVSDITLTIPIYWGTNVPSGTSVTGALYFHIV